VRPRRGTRGRAGGQEEDPRTGFVLWQRTPTVILHSLLNSLLLMHVRVRVWCRVVLCVACAVLFGRRVPVRELPLPRSAGLQAWREDLPRQHGVDVDRYQANTYKYSTKNQILFYVCMYLLLSVQPLFEAARYTMCMSGWCHRRVIVHWLCVWHKRGRRSEENEAKRRARSIL
jgi:hypothetical protein